jgi:putative DNA modification/repair radical SAM protein
MKTMDWDSIKSRLAILADAAKYDASCSSSGSERKRDKNGMGNVEGMGICHSYAPDGRCISLLKILMTNFCIFDCKYCVNRVTSEVKRARFTPEEIVNLTLEFYRRNYIEGLFLSSGIIGSSDSTMEMLIRVARSLRKDHKFNGYIHLKVVAGSSKELILEAGLWADRISANVEMPTQGDLNVLAPAKTISSATKSMNQISEKVTETKEEQKKKTRFVPKFAPAGQTTQMIIGATKSSDALILNASEKMYQGYSLRRVYYSAYSPIPDADVLLPSEQPSLVRENRLYQADWLIRFYDFKAAELTTPEESNLALDIDPKTSWAIKNRSFFPVDVNAATREELLRVPGLGVRNVERIIQMRPFRKITLLDLSKIRVSLAKTKYFVTTSDHNPDAFLIDVQNLRDRLKPPETQLSLFDVAATALTGEI